MKEPLDHHYGLTENQAAALQATFGYNEMHQNHGASMFQIIRNQFASPLIFILAIAAVLTGLLNEWVDTSVIFFAIIINAGLGFYQEYQAENILSTLMTYIKDRARVIRDNREYEIDARELVPGDVIVIAYGSRIPADAHIIESANLHTDEAILTGESQPVAKQPGTVSESAPIAERTNMVHAGTLVVEGFGKAVVTTIGMQTEIGKIASLVAKTNRAKTPLQVGISKLSWFIFLIILIVIVGIFLLGVSKGVPLFEMLILSAAVAVGAVPEALPIALTVILSVGATFIAKKKGIVRKLASAETLGSATLIMTDKTGTLTEANMQLVGVFSLEKILDTQNNSSDNKLQTLDNHQQRLLAQSLYNIDVTALKNDVGTYDFQGKPFEKNLAQVAQTNNLDLGPLFSETNHLVIPFNSTHKFSVAQYGGNYSVMGAPDILLARSNITDDTRLRLESWIHEMSTSGNRLIALATYKHGKHALHVDTINQLEFLGVLAFHDPIRSNVPAAIASIEKRGVRVVMITGDLPGTAMAIGKSLGWDITPDQVITGNDIAQKSDEQLLEIIPAIKIFARVTPEDKLRIGLLYQRLGEVVAMTGDGVNDAPALKAMDIGISLGSASDVAKSAASLVLLDDNFETITASITEGRRILANIQKTFMYLLSNSLDEVIVVAGSLIVGLPLPLTALQIIWVNLFTGSLPAIAFAFDENLEHDHRPQKYHREVFTKEVKYITLGIGTLSSLLLFILYIIFIRSGFSVTEARSLFFVCFATYILVIAFSFRSLHRPIWSYNPFSNKRLNYSILIALIITILTITVPFFQNIFMLEMFDWSHAWIIVVWLIINILLVELAKWGFRTKTKQIEK